MLIRLNRILWLNESINIFLMLHVYSCFSLAFHWTIGVIVFSLPHISLIVFHIWFCLVKLLWRFFIIRVPLILIYVLLVVCVMVQLLINITLSFLLEPFSLFFLVTRLVIRDINCWTCQLMPFILVGMLSFMNLYFISSLAIPPPFLGIFLFRLVLPSSFPHTFHQPFSPSHDLSLILALPNLPYYIFHLIIAPSAWPNLSYLKDFHYFSLFLSYLSTIWFSWIW